MGSSKQQDGEGEIAKRLLELNQWFFSSLLLAFLLLFLVEAIWGGSISRELNANYLNIVMIVAIISGVALLLTPEGKGEPIAGRGYFLIAVAGIATTAIILYKIQGLGWVSYPMAAVSGIAVVLLGIFVLRERTD
ncbi:MAG: hypothetical protein ACE5IA_00850 [Dehalococcoidia bacterium]